ncbi:hypothetical protein POM88_043683 [Heracleum sosnowskyi]|uniref:Uncharacterized protein n=1 Tax=Heracleum sosnowskyi TaxID=360622 RepID=A0AAD8M4H3_9APIA|nr:hypothetical protein POM88_043683 [Heracleum sosnowskyi]
MFGWKLIEQQVLPHNYVTPFWLEITGLPSTTKYIPRLAASSAIISYSFHYFARLMSFTMYGRDEGNNKIQKDELVLLYHFDEGVPADWTNLLISIFLYQATRDRGALVMGGFLTRIAKRLGVFDCNKTNLKMVDGWPTTIDVNYLLGMHMVRPDTLGGRNSRNMIYGIGSSQDLFYAPSSSSIAHISNSSHHNSQDFENLQTELEVMKERMKEMDAIQQRMKDMENLLARMSDN